MPISSNRYHFLDSRERDYVVNLDLVRYLTHGLSSNSSGKYSIVFVFGSDQSVVQYCRTNEEYADVLRKLRALGAIA